MNQLLYRIKRYACLLCVCFGHFISAQTNTFTNPLLPSGADPFSVYVDGYYYYTHTVGNSIKLWKTKNLAHLATAESKTIWIPPKTGMYAKDIWAPEIHYLEGKWYVYFAADDGVNENHRMYAIENRNKDPFSDHWVFKGKLAVDTDKWAIDGNVFRYKEQYYMIWSGWEGDENGQQDIFIAKMKSPTEMEGDRVKIASPIYDWELHGDLSDPENPPHVNVNEGPQFIAHNGHIFIIFSASGCWTDHYSLGVLHFTGKDNLLNPAHWEKQKEPLLTLSVENGVYAPGHNSFFKSPDGKEDWILYHANSEPGQGCGGFRSPRMQRIFWKENGTPFVGKPVSENTELKIPSE